MKQFYYLLNATYWVILLLFMAACNLSELVVKINTAQDRNTQFSQYRTYNWYQPNPTGNLATNVTVNTMLQQHLVKAIEAEFGKKGLQKSAANPQVLLAFDVSVKKPAQLPTQNFAEGFGYGYAYQMGYRYDYGHTNIANYQSVDAYAPGTLIIDVIEAGSKQLIWRGWAEQVVENFNADYQTIQNYVDDIIDKYPAE